MFSKTSLKSCDAFGEISPLISSQQNNTAVFVFIYIVVVVTLRIQLGFLYLCEIRPARRKADKLYE